MLLASGWSLFCLLHITAYTANLATFLVLRATPVAGIESIYDAIAQNKRICVWGAAADYEVISRLHPSANLVKSDSTKAALLDMQAGVCEAAVMTKYAWDVLEGTSKFNGNCSLVYVGRPLSLMSAGFAVAQDSNVKCTSMLREVFDIHFRGMVRDGLIEAAWAKHVARAQNMPDVGGPVACSDSRRSAGGRTRAWGVVGDGVGAADKPGGTVRLPGDTDGRRVGSGGGAGGGEASSVIAVSSNVLTLSDMGGTHATYLFFICLAFMCWAFSTETPEGRKFIVPCLHKTPQSVSPYDPEAVKAGAGAAAADTPIARLELKMECLDRKVERLLHMMELQGGVHGGAEASSRLCKAKGALDGTAQDLQMADL